MNDSYKVVDADGHVLEPPDLWTKNIDKKFRDRAPKIVFDQDGHERIWIDGNLRGHAETLASTGTVGVPGDQITGKRRKYLDGRPGGFDPHARIKDMDLDGVDITVLYPSLGLQSGAIVEPDFAAAVCRTYNCWIADYAKAYPDRLFGVAMLPMQSVEHAISELKYATQNLGLGSAFLRPNPYNDRLLSDPAYDPLWAEAQELDCSIAYHEGTGGMKAAGIDRVNGRTARHVVSHPMEMMLASLNIIWGGVCERFPKLRFGFLECGGGWMPAWLDRMDRHFDRKGVYDDAQVKLPPSEYFRRQCWISFEPVERTMASAADFLGPNRMLWATDYPHIDGYFPGAPKMIAEKLKDPVLRQVLSQGAIEFYPHIER